MRNIKINKSEFQEQREVFQWAEFSLRKYPCLKYMNASLNGFRLTFGQARKAKVSGLKKGVPDICLPVKNKTFGGLYIEMKSKKGRLSTEQKDFIEFLKTQNYMAIVCHGSREAINVIEGYLGDI